MSMSAVKLDATAIDAAVMDERLVVYLADGRQLSAPLAWFPRLLEASAEQRRNWRLIGRGHGIHWPTPMRIFPSPACCGPSDERRVRSQPSYPSSTISSGNRCSRAPGPFASIR